MILLPVKNFMAGLAAPLAGLKLLLARPKLLPWALAPFLLNLLLFGLAFGFGWQWLRDTISWSLSVFQGWWWAALVYLMAVLVVLLVLVVVVYTFALVGSLIAAPFLELLSQRVEKAHAGGSLADTPFSWKGLYKDFARLIGQSCKRLFLYLGLLCLVLLLNLVPLLGTSISSILAGLITCFFLALEFLDYPLDRRALSFGDKLKYVWGLGPAWLGFGLAALGLGLVPLLNLVFLPAACVGGTILFLERPPAGLAGKQATAPAPPLPPSAAPPRQLPPRQD